MTERADEAAFQAQVVELARVLGWETNHTRRSIGRGHRWTTATSKVGWPDLVLWNPRYGGVIFAELKTDTGKVTAEQEACLASLRSAGADVRVWRPSDWPEIEATLQHREAAA